MKTAMTRRGFLGGAATAGALTVLGLTGCAPQTPAEKEEAEASVALTDWKGQEPQTPAEFYEEVDCDVVVCGLGHAGVAATRAAAEAGAHVVVFEKGAKFGLSSANIAAFGSKKWIEMFPECESVFALTDEMINEVSKGCLYRNNASLLKKWAQLNGDAIEWYLGAAPEGEVEWGTAANGNKVSETAAYTITESTYPYPENYDPLDENIPCFPGTAKMGGANGRDAFMVANLDRAIEASDVEVYRETPAIKLIKEGGRIVSVIAQDAQGKYYKANASMGVVLATGDFMNNESMLREFVPRVLVDGYVPFGDANYYTVADANGVSCNTGDGHRMGAWVGARMQEDGCAMSHCVMGSAKGVFGTLPFLMLNVQGKRFFNEDVQGQQYAEQIRLQPKQTAYQIFDGAWQNQMKDMPYGHGKYSQSTTQEMIDKAVEDGGIVAADTIEELCAKIGDIDVRQAIESIEHYNDLCKSGKDIDFGKTPHRLFELATPPFYAITHGKGDDLVTMSGLESDDECRVLDNDFNSIPGLYVAGNVQGGRFAVVYPEVLQGHSVAMAVAFGRLAGQNAARGI